MVICLERDADLHMAQLMPRPLTVSCFSNNQIGLPFWYWLTWVVPEKWPLNGCVCVCVLEEHLLTSCGACFCSYPYCIRCWLPGWVSGLSKLSDEVLAWLSV